MKVKFIGEGTFQGIFDEKILHFGPGDVLDVSDAAGEALLERLEAGQPVWVAQDGAQAPKAAPSASTASPDTSQASPAQQA